MIFRACLGFVFSLALFALLFTVVSKTADFFFYEVFNFEKIESGKHYVFAVFAFVLCLAASYVLQILVLFGVEKLVYKISRILFNDRRRSGLRGCLEKNKKK